MEEDGIIRASAIRLLEAEGVELVLDGQLFARTGIFFSVIAIAFSTIYLINNEVLMGATGAIVGFLSNIVGGVFW